MSFATDPNLYSFVTAPAGCVLCFASGKSPDSIFAQFTGIQIGGAWIAGDPPPPNGQFELKNTGACTWLFNDGVTLVDWDAGSPAASLSSIVLGVATSFINTTTLDPCITEYSNNLSSPIGLKYFGGTAIIMNPLESGARNNIQLMSLLNILPEIRTFCKPQAIATNILSTRYSQRNGRTDIYIKYDFT